jgi:hypothetical protein
MATATSPPISLSPTEDGNRVTASRLAMTDCALSLLIALLPVTAIELGKLIARIHLGRQHLTKEGL